MKENILYFEGAGWSQKQTKQPLADIGHSVIRAAYRLKDDQICFMEFCCTRPSNHLYVKAFLIVEDANPANWCYRIRDTRATFGGHYLPYCKESILKFLAVELRQEYITDLEVLPPFSGYQVFKYDEDWGLNLSNDFQPSPNDWRYPRKCTQCGKLLLFDGLFTRPEVPSAASRIYVTQAGQGVWTAGREGRNPTEWELCEEPRRWGRVHGAFCTCHFDNVLFSASDLSQVLSIHR